nr:antibiotic biosynthesis monooxygenase [uncultured Pseudodesulfovibrio sp.]
MYAVMFEVHPTKKGTAEYFEIAGNIRGFLAEQDGFISIERFQSMNEEGKVLSLSYWDSEKSIEKWRNLLDHRHAQKTGMEKLFHSYRIRVAQVVRDYTHKDREFAPDDSNKILV